MPQGKLPLQPVRAPPPAGSQKSLCQNDFMQPS